jgi:hypothetical protein
MLRVFKGYFDPEHFAAPGAPPGEAIPELRPDRLQGEGKLSGGAVGLGLGLIFAVAALDRFVSGLNLFLLHLVPVGLMAWRGGFTHGLWMAACATLAQLLGESGWSSGLAALVRTGNAALGFGLFAGAAWAVARLKARRHREQALQAHLDESRPDRVTAAAEIKRVHQQLRLYQDWTNYLKRAGHWVSLEDFLSRQKEAEMTGRVVEKPLQLQALEVHTHDLQLRL